MDELARWRRIDPAAADRLARRLRALEIFRHFGEIVVKTRDEQRLLQQLCDLAVDVCGYRMAWVGFGREDAERRVQPVASAGHETGYLEAIEVRWSDTPEGRGPTGRAIRTGRPQIARDLARDPAYAPWREEAVARGYGSSVALPLEVDEPVRGCLNIYAAEPNAFDDDELGLLCRLADSLSHAICALRLEQKRRAAERELRAKTALLQAIYRASPDMIFLHGPGLQIADVNEQTERFYGCSVEALRTLPPQRFIGPPHTPEEAFERVEQALREGAVDFEWVGRRYDGTTFPCEVRLRRLEIDLEQHPDAPRVVALVRDLTERKRAERERMRLEKLRSLGVLAGGIAHDFNNMLTGILGNLSLARSRMERGLRADHLLAQAESACLRARNLTGQLLTFARGGSPQVAPTDLRQVVLETARFCLSGSPIELRTALPDALPAVRADATQLTQVVQNLVINAVQAMPEGGTLTIGAELRDLGPETARAHGLAPGRYVQLTVADDGPGIDPEDLPRVFDPYFTTRTDGTGLGLATVDSIVRRHGGRIELISQPGEGTRFEILLPASEHPPAEGAHAAPAPAPARRRLRVLVLEDDPGVAEVVRAILESEGHEVELTRDGHDTIDAYGDALADGQRFDAVLLDLTIVGGLDGRRTLARLREIDPEVCAIASSGYSAGGEIADHERHGFRAALPKPYRAEELLDLLAALCERR
ncbi:MAG: PAS domain S-box protein [Planctomycetota bacterium]|nr:MAG: PAS domain S-box protein [Planctomycetota bacterium]